MNIDYTNNWQYVCNTLLNQVNYSFFQAVQITGTGRNIPGTVAKARGTNLGNPLQNRWSKLHAGHSSASIAWHQSRFHAKAGQMWIYVPKRLPSYQPDFPPSGDSRKTGNRYIRDQLGHRHPLHVDQYAYRVGLSTDPAFHQTVSMIQGQLYVKGDAMKHTWT